MSTATQDHRFAWKGGGMGRVWFHASTPAGSGEIEYITDQMFCDYHQRTTRPDVWEQEVVPMHNVLRWHASGLTMTPALVAAFNAWRQAEHAALIAQLRADPARYGPVDEANPLLKAPPIVRGANWNRERSAFDIFA